MANVLGELSSKAKKVTGSTVAGVGDFVKDASAKFVELSGKGVKKVGLEKHVSGEAAAIAAGIVGLAAVGTIAYKLLSSDENNEIESPQQIPPGSNGARGR